jgi:hypothetical protein
MFWLILAVVIVLVVLIKYCADAKREERLASVSPEVRERFLKLETKKRKKERLELRMKEARERRKSDSQAARDYGVSRQVDVGRAEGKKFVRVWVPAHKVKAITRWAGRNGLRALHVKDGSKGDSQISITSADGEQL